MSNLIAIDPGKEKCGIVLVDQDLAIVLDGKVVRKEYVLELLDEWVKNNFVNLIILGNGTTSKYWESLIKEKKFSSVQIVEEKNTTFRARDRYWELWPKNFFLSLIPKGMIIPAENLDAIAALVLLEDFLDLRFNWPKKVSFKTWPE